MSPFEEFARRVQRDLDSLHVPWAFVGGLAVSTHGYPRFTNDIDVAVALEGDAEAERLVNLLFRQGYQMLADLERDDGRMSTARLTCPPVRGTEFVLDLIFATTGIERDIVRRAEQRAVFPRFTAAVACLGDLVAMKLLSVSERRMKDDTDLIELLERSTPADIETVKDAISAIMAEGLNRGRDLGASLAEYQLRLLAGSG